MIRKSMKNTIVYVIFIPILSIMISYLTLQIPICIKYAIDGVAYNNKDIIPQYILSFFNENIIQNISVLVIYLAIITLALILLKYMRERMNSTFALKIKQIVRMEIFKHIQKLEYQSYYEYDKNEMLQRITEDADTFADFFQTSFTLILDTFFILVFVISQSVKLNVLIAGYIVASVVVLILFAIWYIKKLSPKIWTMVKANRKLLTKVIDCVTVVKMTRMFNKQEEEKKEYHEINKGYLNSCLEFINLVLFHEIITDHISYLARPVIYMIGRNLSDKTEN